MSAGRLVPRALAVLCLGLATPALAQMDGVEPCLASHFDPARYQSELESLGWRLATEAERPAALERLADGFIPLSATDFTFDTADLPALRAAQRARWAQMTDGRRILVRVGQTMFIGGDTHDDGRRRVSCWFVSSDDPLMTQLFQIWTENGQTESTGAITLAAAPTATLPDGGELHVFAATVAPDPAPEPPLAATDAMLIRVIIPAEDAK